MLWIILSLSTALVVATHDTWIKKSFSEKSVYEMVSYPLFYSLPLFMITSPFVTVPQLDNIFLYTFLISLPINGLAFSLHIKAIQVSPLSLTLPYLAFTPAFILFTGYLILNEIPNIAGITGVIVICFGGYILNIDPGKYSFLAPFKNILKEPGSWIMLIVAFIYSLAAVIGKKAIQHSSPLFFSISFYIAFNFLMLVAFWMIRKIRIRDLLIEKNKGMVAGLLFFAHVFFHNYSIILTKAAYMISVKRFNTVFALIYGGVIFKEKNLSIRLTGTLLMIGGTLFISLMGN